MESHRLFSDFIWIVFPASPRVASSRASTWQAPLKLLKTTPSGDLYITGQTYQIHAPLALTSTGSGHLRVQESLGLTAHAQHGQASLHLPVFTRMGSLRRQSGLSCLLLCSASKCSLASRRPGDPGSSSPLWPPVCPDHHEQLPAREPGFACSILASSDMPQPVLWTQPTVLCHVTAGLLMEISKASDKQTKRTSAGKAIKRPHPVLPSYTDDGGARLASLAQNPPNSPCEKCAQRFRTLH